MSQSFSIGLVWLFVFFCGSVDDGYIRPVTFWVVGDFDRPSGRKLLYDAIRHMVWRLLDYKLCDKMVDTE